MNTAMPWGSHGYEVEYSRQTLVDDDMSIGFVFCLACSCQGDLAGVFLPSVYGSIFNE